MKIVIVGGTSSLGRALKPTLSKFSEVITAGRTNCDITLDLSDPIEKIILPDNIDVVINTAAHFGGNSIKEILEAENVNVLGNLKLCNAAINAKTKEFILVSSIYSSLKENSINYSTYSITKKQAEDTARLYCSLHSLPLIILKPSQLYGCEDSFRRHQPFLYDIIDKAENNQDVVLYGSNDALRNYIHVDDLVNIIVRIIHSKLVGTYTCMYTKNVTYSQIAKAAFVAFSSTGQVHFLKEKKDIPDNTFEKDNSLYDKIGYYPEVSIEDGMKKIAQYRKRQK